MTLLRGFLKTLIALFCVWHMAAIGIYSLYHVDNYPVLNWLNSKRDIFRPYILTTSQWQRWNLFSPDPLRRVIQMTIEQQINGQWETVAVINEHTVGFWRRATELKTVRRMEDEDYQPLQERYVHVFCKTESIPVGTPMRLRKQWFVIPKHETMHSQQWWNNWQPEWNNDVLLETTCPETL